MAHFKVALEVHLPQHVGGFMLEALPRVLDRFAAEGVEHPVPPQDAGDGARRRWFHSQRFEAGRDLASAPRRMLSPQRQRLGECVGRRECSARPAAPC